MAICPECQLQLVKPGECSACGWNRDTRKSTSTGRIYADHGCAYSAGGRKCPAPGALSHNTRGGGPYYCRWHFAKLHDPRECDMILADFIANGVPRQVDWRDELIAKEIERRKLARFPEETAEEYRERMQRAFKLVGNEFRPRLLPYEKTSAEDDAA